MQQQPQTDRRALRVNDAARLYGVSRSTLYKLFSEGKLKPTMIGGRRLVPVAEMERLLAEGSK